MIILTQSLKKNNTMDTLTDPPISSLFHLVVKLRYYHHSVGAPY
uniref:Uncharacterized protein n=1 Tax=Anguilla anguilla TaxID=7936 RepID=A0A0E9RGE7_ANGAN